jgi:hypothetical protein
MDMDMYWEGRKNEGGTACTILYIRSEKSLGWTAQLAGKQQQQQAQVRRWGCVSESHFYMGHLPLYCIYFWSQSHRLSPTFSNMR